jgi:hypothetical protein
MMLSQTKEDMPLSNPKMVYLPNTSLNTSASDPYEYYFEGVGATDYLPVRSGQVIKYYNPSTGRNIGHILIFNANKQRVDYWNCRTGDIRSFTATNFSGDGYFRTCVVMDGEADSYCYNNTSGQVYYAGINTPYYGKTNIND